MSYTMYYNHITMHTITYARFVTTTVHTGHYDVAVALCLNFPAGHRQRQAVVNNIMSEAMV